MLPSENQSAKVRLTASSRKTSSVETFATTSSNETMITEQITASAVGENIDSALISAGEKFLELSAKMCAPSSIAASCDGTVKRKNEKLKSIATTVLSLDGKTTTGKGCTLSSTNVGVGGGGEGGGTPRLWKQSNNVATPVQQLTASLKKDYSMNPQVMSRNIDIGSSSSPTGKLASSSLYVVSSGTSGSNLVTATTLPETIILSSNSKSGVTSSPSVVTVQPMNTDLLASGQSTSESVPQCPTTTMLTTHSTTSAALPDNSALPSPSNLFLPTGASSAARLRPPVTPKLNYAPIPINNNLNVNDDSTPCSVQTTTSNVLINSKQSTPINTTTPTQLTSTSAPRLSDNTASHQSIAAPSPIQQQQQQPSPITNTFTDQPVTNTSASSTDADFGCLDEGDDSSSSFHRRTTSESSTDSGAESNRSNCSLGGKKRKLDEMSSGGSASEFTKSVLETAVSARTQASWIRGAAK